MLINLILLKCANEITQLYLKMIAKEFKPFLEEDLGKTLCFENGMNFIYFQHAEK